jgi:hypothetical protein
MPFNRCKSAIKTLDYVTIGMAVLASDLDVYRGSVRMGRVAGAERRGTWFVALAHLARHCRTAASPTSAPLSPAALGAQARERRRASLVRDDRRGWSSMRTGSAGRLGCGE